MTQTGKGPVYEATVGLHHAVEHTRLGQAVGRGVCTRAQYASFLLMQAAIQRRVDPHVQPELRRYEAILHDVLLLEVVADTPRAARDFADCMMCPNEIRGAHYVLLGAMLMGGPVIASRAPHLPATHLQWPSRELAMSTLRVLRWQPEIIDGARACFKAMLESCEGVETADAR